MAILNHFAACNSVYGFYSYFDELFFKSDIKKRYLIKGGPGTGKSTFMKAVACEAEKRGFAVEAYYCSSDPSSLDGIIIKEMGICLFDATSPHVSEPMYPFVRDTVLSMDCFLNGEALEKSGERIVDLYRENKELYDRAYRALAAAGRIRENIYSCTRGHLDEEKIVRAAKNYAYRFSSSNGDVCMRLISSVGPSGNVSFDTYSKTAKRIYYVQDRFCVAPCLFELIKKYARGALTLMIDPVDPKKLQGLYFHGTDTLFTSNKDLVKSRERKVIHSARFTDEFTKENKNKLRFEAKIYLSLLDHACNYFAKAKEKHDELEKYYSSAMDFDAMRVWTEEFISKLFCLR